MPLNKNVYRDHVPKTNKTKRPARKKKSGARGDIYYSFFFAREGTLPLLSFAPLFLSFLRASRPGLRERRVAGGGGEKRRWRWWGHGSFSNQKNGRAKAPLRSRRGSHFFIHFFFSFFRTLSGSLTLCRLSSALCRGLIFYITGTID